MVSCLVMGILAHCSESGHLAQLRSKVRLPNGSPFNTTSINSNSVKFCNMIGMCPHVTHKLFYIFIMYFKNAIKWVELCKSLEETPKNENERQDWLVDE